MNPYEVPEGYTVVSRLDALLDRLETVEFDVMVNLASGLQLAVDIAAQQPAVRALVEHLRSHPGEAERLLSRVEALATAPVDQNWRSPYEAALIGMLVVAFDVEPRLGVMAAERARSTPQAPWIPRLADSIVASVPATDFMKVTSATNHPAREQRSPFANSGPWPYALDTHFVRSNAVAHIGGMTI